MKVELSDNNASEPGADVSRPTPENISESEGAEGEEDIISDFISIYDEGQEILVCLYALLPLFILTSFSPQKTIGYTFSNFHRPSQASF